MSEKAKASDEATSEKPSHGLHRRRMQEVDSGIRDLLSGSSKNETTSIDTALDKLGLGIFDENEAKVFLDKPMLRLTFGSDYAQRIDFTNGEVLKTVLHANDILKDQDISVLTRAKAQLLLDAAKIKQVDVDAIGALGQYVKGVQEH